MMQSKRFRALAMVGALTLAVCTGTTAMAEEAAPMGNSPEIQKIFQMSEGMDVPSVSFKFTLEKVTADAPTAQVSPEPLVCFVTVSDASCLRYVFRKLKAGVLFSPSLATVLAI